MSDVDVQFGANTGDVDKGVASVNAKLDDLSKQVNSLGSNFTNFSGQVQTAFAQVETGIAGIGEGVKALFEAIKSGDNLLDSGIFKLLLGAGIGAAITGLFDAVHHLNDEAGKIPDNAKYLGLEIDKFQELQTVLDKEGKSDELTKSLGEAAKKLNELNHSTGELGKFLDKNNVKWKDASGQIIDFNKYLEVSARLIANAGTQLDRVKAGKILGFDDDTIKKLAEGPVAFQKALEKAEEEGDHFTKDQIEKAKEFDKAWNDASGDWMKVFKGAIVAITPYVMELLSALNKVVDYLKDTFKSAIEEWSGVFKAAIAAIFPYIQELLSWLNKAAQYIGIVASSLGQAIKEDFADAIGGLRTVKMPVEPMAGTMESNISSMQQFMSVTNNADKVWQKMVDDAKAMNKEIMEMASNSMPTTSATKFPKKGDDKVEMTQLNEQLDQWREYYAKLVVFEKNSVDTFKQTETQKVTNLLAALNEREAAEKAIFEKEIQAAGDNANRIAEIRRRMNKEIETIDKERMQLEAENLKRSTQEWNSALSGITGAFNSQLKGLLAGTTSWATAMKNIAADLVIKIIEEFEKLAIIQPLIKMLTSAGIASPQSFFSGLFGGGGQAAATTANTSALTALTTAVATLTAAMGGNTAAVGTQAATAATSTVATGAQTVATTVQTTATVAETAATTADAASHGGSFLGSLFSAIGAIAAFDVGTNYVPRTGLALIHEGEAIIPAAYNPTAGGGGSGTLSANFTIQALDSAGVQAFFTRYGPQIAKMLSAHMAQNPSFQT